MSRYQRRFPRPEYEFKLVEAYGIIGYQLVLSTGFEDEQAGVDAWLPEYGIPIDFTIVTNPLNVRAVEKVRKDQKGCVAVLEIPSHLIHDLDILEKRDRVYQELEVVFSDFLDRLSSQFLTFVTREETQGRERVWVEPLGWKPWRG